MPSHALSSIPRRKYGSVDDTEDVHHVIADFGVRANTREGERQRRRRRRKWIGVAIVSTLAAGVILGLAPFGGRLPTTAGNLTQTGLVEATGGFVTLTESDGIETTSLPASEAAHRSGGSSGRGGGSGDGGGGGRGQRVEVDSSSNTPAKRKYPSFSRPAELAAAAGSLPALSFTALNFYQERDGKPGADYPWLKDVKLIEPHRETTLAVQFPRDGFEYRWAVSGVGPDGAAADDDLRAVTAGPEAVVVLTALDENVITLEEVDAETGKVARRLEERVMVKYVRREIRTLTEGEREELMDAMYTLWSVRVDGGNGRELYGEGYADIYSINLMHYKAAAPVECDHFHDGLGFLTSHSMISNTFEYSLQAVNPKLTLPYWDFTIDSSSAVGGSSTDVHPEVFSPNWFGTYDPADNMVKDSRWANTTIPEMSLNNPGGVESDVYGKLRAPWNVNNRPFLTRGMGKMCGADLLAQYPWPTCEMHYELATEYDSFYSYVWQSLYAPHGPVHVWIGGVLDCEELYAKIGELVGSTAAADLAMYSFYHRKNLYRAGMFSCEGTGAAVDEAPEQLFANGQCGCLEYDLTQGDDYKAVYAQLYPIDKYIGYAPAEIKRQVVQAICSSPVNDGDHLQASSSLDPSFWPTHPTMERLWMYAVLTGHVTDWTWPDSDDWYVDADGSVISQVVSLYSQHCVGHRGSDVFPYGLLDSEADKDFVIRTGIRGNSPSGNELSNREALAAFDPRSNSLPYVYDTFAWPHCEADGVDFGAAWQPTRDKKDGEQRRRSRKVRPPVEEGGGEGGFPRPLYSGVIRAMERAREDRRAAESANDGGQRGGQA